MVDKMLSPWFTAVYHDIVTTPTKYEVVLSMHSDLCDSTTDSHSKRFSVRPHVFIREQALDQVKMEWHDMLT